MANITPFDEEMDELKAAGAVSLAVAQWESSCVAQKLAHEQMRLQSLIAAQQAASQEADRDQSFVTFVSELACRFTGTPEERVASAMQVVKCAEDTLNGRKRLERQKQELERIELQYRTGGLVSVSCTAWHR